MLPVPYTLTQRILEASLDLILVVDRIGTFVWVSPSSITVLGYSPEEMIGHSATQFLFPADLENTRQMMRESKRGTQVRHFDCRYVHKDGRIVLLTWTGQYDNEHDHYHFIGRDITEARLAEEFGDFKDELVRLRRTLTYRTRALVFMRTADVYVFELFAICSSFWAAWVLTTGPSNFSVYSATFLVVQTILPDEKFWGAFAFLSAMIKSAGILLGWRQFYNKNSLYFRIVGMQMSALFWTLMGASTVYGNPDTLFGMIGLFLGVASQFVVFKLGSAL